MAPDRGFTKQIKTVDKDLEVVWDWAASRWKIYKFPESGSEPYHVLTVETKNKSYKALSAEVLLKLKQIYSMTPKETIDYVEECNNQLLRRKRREFLNKIEAIALDTFINVHCKVIQVHPKYFVEPCLARKIEEVARDA